MVNADADQVADVTLLPILFGCWLLVQSGWGFIGRPCLPMLWRLSIRPFASSALVTCMRMRRLLPCCADSGLMLLTVHDLCAELIGPAEFQSAGVHHQPEAFVAEIHTDTWTSFPHLAQALATLKCTRPGDPFGSAIFKF